MAEVAPELVIFGEDGQPESVKYHLVNVMLLEVVKRQEERIKAHEAALRADGTVRRDPPGE